MHDSYLSHFTWQADVWHLFTLYVFFIVYVSGWRNCFLLSVKFEYESHARCMSEGWHFFQLSPWSYFSFTLVHYNFVTELLLMLWIRRVKGEGGEEKEVALTCSPSTVRISMSQSICRAVKQSVVWTTKITVRIVKVQQRYKHGEHADPACISGLLLSRRCNPVMGTMHESSTGCCS